LPFSARNVASSVTSNVHGEQAGRECADSPALTPTIASWGSAAARSTPDGKRVAVSGDIVIAALAGGDVRIVKAPDEKAVRMMAWNTAGDTIAVGTPEELQFHDLESDYDWTIASRLDRRARRHDDRDVLAARAHVRREHDPAGPRSRRGWRRSRSGSTRAVSRR
jgi:hypothetical protein